MINPNSIRFWWNGNGGGVVDDGRITDILSFNDRERITFATNRPIFTTDSEDKAYLETNDDPAAIAVIPDAIPETGTILLWVRHGTSDDEPIIDGDGYLLDKTSTALRVDIAEGTIRSATVEWNPTSVTKLWFYAVVIGTTTVKVYRADREGNLSLVIDTTHEGVLAGPADLSIQSSTPASATLAQYSDILTTDEQLTQAQIEEIYVGALPINQFRGYGGDNVDRLQQKVARETNGTFDTETNMVTRKFLSFDIYGVYEPIVNAYYNRIEADGGITVGREQTNQDILNIIS
jgi:hypothetical protein